MIQRWGNWPYEDCWTAALVIPNHWPHWQEHSHSHARGGLMGDPRPIEIYLVTSLNQV